MTKHTKEEMPDIPQFIPLTRVAARLGINTRTLRNWQERGVQGCPKAVQIGDKLYSFAAPEIEAWIKERARVSREERPT